MCARWQQTKPNLTHSAYAAPGLARAGLSVIPDTAHQAAVDIVALGALKPLLFTGKAVTSVGRQLYYVKTLGSQQGTLGFALAEELGAASVSRGYTGRAIVPRMLRESTNREMLAGYSSGTLYTWDRLTKGQIVEYLQALDMIPMSELANNLEKIGLRLLERRPDKKIYKFSHIKNELRGTTGVKANLDSSNFMIELHFDVKSGPHMHITDGKGNVYDKMLNNLTAKFRKANPGWHENKVKEVVKKLPDAHIKIKEFVGLTMRPENVYEVQLSDMEGDGFLHSDVKDVMYDGNKKIFIVKLTGADLKIGGIFYNCTITITDWWDFEVLQFHGSTIINKFKDSDVPELDSIVEFTYDGNILVLEDLCGIDELYHFKFTKPKIKITGDYDSD